MRHISAFGLFLCNGKGFGRTREGFGRTREGFGRTREGFGKVREGFGRPRQSNRPLIRLRLSLTMPRAASSCQMSRMFL
jgi:hypothetical protein